MGSIGGWAVAVGRGVGLIATWDAPDGAQPAPSATAIASTVSVSLPAPKDILDRLTAEADFVVSAMAD